MDLVLGMAVTFFLLLFFVMKGGFVGIPLAVGYLIFALIARRRGFGFGRILRMSYEGGKKSYVALVIFVLIGAIIAAWMSAGTVPGVIYYGIQLIHPRFFILSAFLQT